MLKKVVSGVARRRTVVCAAGWVASAALAASELPPDAQSALQRARVPLDALSVVVQEVGTGRTVLSLRAQEAVNPASIVKLVTTYAALDVLGPAWTWSTPVWLQGTVREGTLDGNLVIKGQGDPKLVIERVWLLLRRVKQLGVREIKGDIVLDRSAFAPAELSPADFDGDSTRPYNVQPDALLLNYKSVVYTFVPDVARGLARVVADPDLSTAQPERTVPLASGPCEDWRSALKATPADGAYRFAGSYAAACGEQTWPLADADSASYNARLLATIWSDMGGRLLGSVRDGPSPAAAKPTFEQRSPALSEVIRDINKFSNNVMAQQLFLTLAAQRQPGVPASNDGARDTLRRWVVERLGEPPADLVLDNGSGLSRQTRLNAMWLARLLQQAQGSAVMSELMSSLPVSGLDGTLRRARATTGRAHLKTGSLRDVAGVAGYVLSDTGRRYVLVAIINHANANQARPALDALVQWAVRDSPTR